MNRAFSPPVAVREVPVVPRTRFEILARRWRLLLRDPVTLIAAALFLAIVLVALLAPWISSGDPYTGSALRRLRPIGSPGHWLGTDELGRDMWARLAFGARLSLLAGLLPIAVALAIGGALGVVAGFAGGAVNSVMMRVMDIFYAFPSVLLAIVICTVVGTGVGSTVLALTIVFVPPIVRISETVTTKVRNTDYIDAARASGVSTTAIILRQVLPNVMGPILVYATSLAGVSISLAASLSFLGLGVPPPNPEWGQMLNSLRQSIYVQPWLVALPGMMIFATAVCLNLIADGLRSVMDVHDKD